LAWHFEFYHVNPDGTLTGGHKIAEASDSVAAAIAQAQSIMRDVTFAFGKANLCLIKTKNGSVICKVEATQ